MTALRFLHKEAETYKLNLDQCVLTGDSADALLSFFTLSINSSEKLQQKFGIAGAGFSFKAAGLISIMLDTQRRDFMGIINNVITDKNDKGKAYEKYLLDPAKLLENVVLPPVYLITSQKDLIRKDTLKLKKLLEDQGVKHALMDFPKGQERKLIHLFSV